MFDSLSDAFLRELAKLWPAYVRPTYATFWLYLVSRLSLRSLPSLIYSIINLATFGTEGQHLALHLIITIPGLLVFSPAEAVRAPPQPSAAASVPIQLQTSNILPKVWKHFVTRHTGPRFSAGLRRGRRGPAAGRGRRGTARA